MNRCNSSRRGRAAKVFGKTRANENELGDPQVEQSRGWPIQPAKRLAQNSVHLSYRTVRIGQFPALIQVAIGAHLGTSRASA